MAAHGAGAVALVEVVRALFGGERQATEGALEGGGGMHRARWDKAMESAKNDDELQWKSSVSAELRG